MSAAKTPATRARRAKAKSATAKRVAAKRAGPASPRPFRFTAAQTVQIRFEGKKKPENFRVDDMAEAAIATLDGQTKLYFQYKIISNDKKHPDGSDRCFWFFDPKPVGAADPIAPSLWRPVGEQAVDGHKLVASHSGNFSTRSVTGYDGSGACHVVKLDDTPSYLMRFDFNGKRECCERLRVAIGKGDVLLVSGS